MLEEQKNTTLKCPYCKKELFYRFEEDGQKILCLNCGQLFQIGNIKLTDLSGNQNIGKAANSEEKTDASGIDTSWDKP